MDHVEKIVPSLHAWKKEFVVIPREFVPHTKMNETGYFLYQRRKNERFVMKGKARLDNRYVVPYNMEILKKYKVHINVEWCAKSKAIKYLFKYITKGVFKDQLKVLKIKEEMR